MATFYDKDLPDDLLGEVFQNWFPKYVQYEALFVAEVLGGDNLYTREETGHYTSMIGHHLGIMLTDEKRLRWVHLVLISG